jgi:hypothetical protein
MVSSLGGLFCEDFGTVTNVAKRGIGIDFMELKQVESLVTRNEYSMGRIVCKY